MRTNRILLRHAQPDDYRTLHAIESDPTTAQTWRYRGNLPVLEEYEPALWKQTSAILVAESVTTGRIHGYLQLYDVDLRAPNGWFSLYAAPEHRGKGTLMEGLMLFCESAFGNWPFRWLYAHAFAHNVEQFSSGFRRGEAVVLGVLRERVVVADELTDVSVIGIEREAWLASPLRRRHLALRARAGAQPDASTR